MFSQGSSLTRQTRRQVQKTIAQLQHKQLLHQAQVQQQVRLLASEPSSKSPESTDLPAFHKQLQEHEAPDVLSKKKYNATMNIRRQHFIKRYREVKKMQFEAFRKKITEELVQELAKAMALAIKDVESYSDRYKIGTAEHTEAIWNIFTVLENRPSAKAVVNNVTLLRSVLRSITFIRKEAIGGRADISSITKRKELEQTPVQEFQDDLVKLKGYGDHEKRLIQNAKAGQILWSRHNHIINKIYQVTQQEMKGSTIETNEDLDTNTNTGLEPRDYSSLAETYARYCYGPGIVHLLDRLETDAENSQIMKDVTNVHSRRFSDAVLFGLQGWLKDCRQCGMDVDGSYSKFVLPIIEKILGWSSQIPLNDKGTNIRTYKLHRSHLVTRALETMYTCGYHENVPQIIKQSFGIDLDYLDAPAEVSTLSMLKNNEKTNYLPINRTLILTLLQHYGSKGNLSKMISIYEHFRYPYPHQPKPFEDDDYLFESQNPTAVIPIKAYYYLVLTALPRKVKTNSRFFVSYHYFKECLEYAKIMHNQQVAKIEHIVKKGQQGSTKPLSQMDKFYYEYSLKNLRSLPTHYSTIKLVCDLFFQILQDMPVHRQVYPTICEMCIKSLNDFKQGIQKDFENLPPLVETEDLPLPATKALAYQIKQTKSLLLKIENRIKKFEEFLESRRIWQQKKRLAYFQKLEKEMPICVQILTLRQQQKNNDNSNGKSNKDSSTKQNESTTQDDPISSSLFNSVAPSTS